MAGRAHALAINPDGEGDAFAFCGSCAFAPVCLPSGYDKQALAALHLIIEHVGPFPPGTHVFRARDPFQAVFAVRTGTVKTYLVEHCGVLPVTSGLMVTLTASSARCLVLALARFGSGALGLAATSLART